MAPVQRAEQWEPIKLLTDRPAWQADAACRGSDPSMFFPTRGEDHTAALEVCAGCAVRQECFDFAMAHREIWGIWAGTSDRARRRLRREARSAAA